MEVDISLVLGFAGTVIAIASFFIARMGDARKLEHRLTSIEGSIESLRVKVDPIWDAIISELPKMLIKKDTPELDEILRKHLAKKSALSEREQLRLIELLDEEHLKAVETQDSGRALAITLFRATVRVARP